MTELIIKANNPLLNRSMKSAFDLLMYLMVKIDAHRMKKYGAICKYPFLLRLVTTIRDTPPINPQNIPFEPGFEKKV